MTPDLETIIEDALRVCFQRVADAFKGKFSAAEAASQFTAKAAELLAELQRGPVDWDSAPHRWVRQLFRPNTVDQAVRLQVTVERFATPSPITLTIDDRREQHVSTEVSLLDAQRSSIPSLPVTEPDLVAKLDNLRIAGRRFEVLGVVTAVPTTPNRNAFRLLVLDVRPIATTVDSLRATQQEVRAAEGTLYQLLQRGETPFGHVRQVVCDRLGIIEVEDDDPFGRAIDTTILAAFSCGHVSSTPANLHHLVIGPSGIGKKLLAQITRALQPVASEIGVTKVTEAGLCGAARRKDGIWTHTPGLLPRAHGGAFVAEDVHELTVRVRRSLTGVLLKLMEDGRLIDSTAAATEYEVCASVYFDQNISADVWHGDAEPTYSFAALQLPKHFLSRADFISALPRDVARQRQLATEIAGAPDGLASTDESWKRELQVLVALLRDRFPDPKIGGVRAALRRALEELCAANVVELGAPQHFDDFLTRIAVSLRKTVKAVCRARALDIATPAEVDEAKRLLTAKVEFLAKLEPGVVTPKSWTTRDARRRGVRQEFGGQEVTVDDVQERYAEQGANVNSRTVRRDLAALGGELVGKGRWLLPEQGGQR